MKKKGYSDLVTFCVLTLVAFFIALIAIPRFFAVSYSTNLSRANAAGALKMAETSPEELSPVVAHVATPKEVKAIYMSACAASAPSFRDRLVKLVETTELNSIIIDVKDYSGTISFPVDPGADPKLVEVKGPGCIAKDLKDFIALLHEKGIYVIARITVFQDPYYAKIHPEVAVKRVDNGEVWKDRKGLSFIDVGATPFWEYIVELSKESHAIGFDEINFDYIRYPSDGSVTNAQFTWSVEKGMSKPEALEKFFAYLDEKLHAEGIVISADIFGMTTTAKDDMGIGQLLEDALKYFDFVAPMVYPSHYSIGFNGWKDVNAPTVVGPLIQFVMASAVDRANLLEAEIASSTMATSTKEIFLKRINPLQLRPWLQDDDYPVAYTPDMVRAQIQGTYDAGLTSWMLWDASNQYTKSALLPE